MLSENLRADAIAAQSGSVPVLLAGATMDSKSFQRTLRYAFPFAGPPREWRATERRKPPSSGIRRQAV
jgi:hypothetical protein